MDAVEIDVNGSVYELCRKYPGIREAMTESGFTDILKPGMLETAGRFMTIPKGAALKNIDPENVKKIFLRHGYIIKEEWQ
jgi:hypothetical protein